MKVYLGDQSSHFGQHLATLTSIPAMAYDKSELMEQVTTIDICTTKKIGQLDLGFLFDYHVFPTKIMVHKTQWAMEEREMKIGDTIVQQVNVPPFAQLSVKIVFGVRITEVINQVDKKGFSYETLRGHVEKGISTFTIEQAANGLIFKIHTFSKPGNFITGLLGPIFSTPYQTYCTKAALKNVKMQVEFQA